MSAITKFTVENRAAILGAIKLGVSIDAAARAGNADRTTVWRWVQRGRDDIAQGIESEWADFARKYASAEAEVSAQVEANIVEQSRQNWKAGAWWLDRRKPDVYSRQATLPIAQQIADAFLHRIRQRCRPETYKDVCDNALGDFIEASETK